MAALLEREALLEAMQASADQAARGNGHTVLASGEAGVGKTSLLERFTSGFEHGRVLWGGCEALATPRPLGPLHDVAAQCGGALAERLASSTDGAGLFAAVLQELSRAPTPTLLVIEDLHWADEATLDLVKYLGRRIHQVPALLLLSHRDDPASLERLRPLLGDLPTTHTTRLSVPLLSRDAVDRISVGASRKDAARIHAATGGNAFFVAELLRQGGEGAAVPETVRDAVLARAASLAAPALQVLHLVAIVPTQAEIALVDAVLAPSADAVDACVASGLLVTDGRRLRFRHELARSAVEASVPPLRAAQFHARLLGELAARREGTVSFAALAHHA
ncbi:MAG: AAA family ATPase, partial [Pseudomonadota bacterium]|nr:AAA family ATPase [Pseudomonadota bacterium]